MHTTEKLYLTRPHDSIFTARVLSCKPSNDPNNGRYEIILDQTLFYPEGGGQPGDSGFIGNVRVSDTQEKGETPVHYVDENLAEGTEYSCEIDWRRRFGFMQNHTGEHILSGVLLARHGLNNVGFHIGSDFTTMDTDAPISDSDLAAAEILANRAVYGNFPVSTLIPEPAELMHMNFRCKLSSEILAKGGIRIVRIPGTDDCACCGTHCKSTGEVGIIKVVTSKPYKGGTRIYFLCGEPALLDYAKKNDAAYRISALLSSKPLENVEAVEALKAEYAALRIQAGELKNCVYDQIADAVAENAPYAVEFMDNLPPDDLRRFAQRLGAKACLAVAFSLDGAGFRYAIHSREGRAKEISTHLNAAFGGKGGGNNELAQGSLSGEHISTEELKAVIGGFVVS